MQDIPFSAGVHECHCACWSNRVDGFAEWTRSKMEGRGEEARGRRRKEVEGRMERGEEGEERRMRRRKGGKRGIWVDGDKKESVVGVSEWRSGEKKEH